MKFQRDKYIGSEADVVGELYYQCQINGLEAYLEVRLPSTVHRSGEMRVDLVIVRDDEVLCLVEVKRAGRKIIEGSRQHRAYSATGVKFFYCIGKEEIQKTISLIKSL